MTSPTSLVSWNIDRLASYLSASTPLSRVLETVGTPDVLCLQEVRLRPSDAELLAAARVALPHYDFACSLAADPFNATFRGGRTYGVATYAAKKLGRTTTEHASWDREGRVLVTLLHAQRLAVVNLYAVNGTSKNWYDDRGNVVGDRHSFKQRFQGSLLELGLDLRERGFELIMVGDWNVSRAKIDVTPRLRIEEPHATARAHLNDVVIPSLDLVDAFRALHPDAKQYTWFHRRAHEGRLDAARVDYALVSRSMMPRVELAEIDTREGARFGSDHAPLGLVWRRPQSKTF